MIHKWFTQEYTQLVYNNAAHDLLQQCPLCVVAFTSQVVIKDLVMVHVMTNHEVI